MKSAILQQDTHYYCNCYTENGDKTQSDGQFTYTLTSEERM